MDLIYEVTLSLLQDSRESNDFFSPSLTYSINSLSSSPGIIPKDKARKAINQEILVSIFQHTLIKPLKTHLTAVKIKDTMYL